MNTNKLGLVTALICALAGCGDDDGTSMDSGIDRMAMDGGADMGGADMGGDDMGADAPMDATMDAGPGELCPTASVLLDPVSGEPALAQISTDFSSTSVSLVGADDTVLAADWLTSGTMAPELSAALSGDVVFPSVNPDDGTITVIDRFGTDVVTRFCIASGSLVGQLSVGTEMFASNPQDVVIVGDEGYVTRYEQNAMPDAAEADRGSDILGFNARTMELNGLRIDLSEFGGMVPGLEEGADVMVETGARPDRMVAVGGYLAVGLDRLPVNLFGMARGSGEGALAIVDLATNEVSSIALPNGRNCGTVVPSADRDDQVIVSCSGYSNEFFGGPGTRESSGIYIVTIAADGTATIDAFWQPSGDDLDAVGAIVSLGGTRVAAVATGEFMVSSDQAVLVDVADGSQTVLAEASAGFAFGVGSWDGSVLRIPDSMATDVGTVVRIELDGMDPVVSTHVYSDSLPAAALVGL